ncbi:MAG: hypothetical protein ACRC0Y_04105 [Fusobacteriaceae bacterium]
MRIEIKKKGDYIDFAELVGKEVTVKGKKTLIHKWDNERKELGVMVSDEMGSQLGAEVVSLAFGIITFIEKVNSYGFDVIITEGILYSYNTKQKAQGLIQAGFSKLIINNDNTNYTVDGIFTQTLLTEDELVECLNSNLSEVELMNVK